MNNSTEEVHCHVPTLSRQGESCGTFKTTPGECRRSKKLLGNFKRKK